MRSAAESPAREAPAQREDVGASAPRVLVVGAGAVGQVYAHYMVRGGARVSLLVKPKHLEACRAGFVLYPLRGRGRGRGHPLRDLELLTSSDEVAARRWDQVWLCVSSTGLRGGADSPEAPSWLDALLPAIGDATIVSLQPDLGDRAFLTHRVPGSQLVTGLISFAAYQHPLPGAPRRRAVKSDAPGVAFYEPPLGPNLFSGERARVDAVVAALRRGGGPARRVKDVPKTMAFSSAMLIPGVAALEVAGWSLHRLTTPPGRALARDAIRQATAVARPGYMRWLVALFTSALVLRIAGVLAPRLAPFDLEVYLRYHFSKVGDQTRLMITTFRDRARAQQLPCDALETLLERLGEHP